jgi:predicted acyl esterase
VANGYVVLNPDTRGAYKSGGNLVFFGRQLAEDGYDFIEWAAAQDWSNGRIGLVGNSWLAISQWFIAAERPPHLAAIAPWEGLSDLMREVSLRGGIPMLDFPEMIIQTLAGELLVEDPARMAMTEQDDTLYWQDKRARLERIEVPTYIVASYDHHAHTYGTLEAFRRIASKDKWLRIHNTHEWPDFYDPRWSAELMAFFDHYLKGEANDWPETTRVRIAVHRHRPWKPASGAPPAAARPPSSVPDLTRKPS